MTGKNTLQSEMRIMLRLIYLGFIVSRCDDAFQAYDLISDWRGVLNRLQVKDNARRGSGLGRESKGFLLRVFHRRGQVGYIKSDCDFILAPVYDTDDNPIYVIPVEVLRERVSVSLWPEGYVHGKAGRHASQEFERFKNAFELLKS